MTQTTARAPREQVTASTTVPVVVAVANRKGGSGKTTTTLNLAGALAERGRRVLLCDLDPQASLTRLLLGDAADERDGIGNRILNQQQGLDGLALEIGDCIDLLPGDRAIETAQFALADNPRGSLILRRLLGPLRGYDVILLDTPPALNLALNSALLAAAIAIIPTRLVQQDIDALVDTIALRDDLALDFTPAERLILLPNEFRRDSNDKANIQALAASYPDTVAAPIPHSVAVKHALNNRQPVVVYDGRSPVAQAYRQLADRLEQEMAGGGQG